MKGGITATAGTH